MSSTTSFTFGTTADLAHFRSKWGWIVALGALLIVGGAIALFDISMATLVTVYYVGAAMLAAGVMEIVTAFQIRPLGRAILWAAIGALTFFAGILAFRDPLMAALSLTAIIGVALIVSGIFRLILAYHIREIGPWGLVALSGLVSIVIGALIVAQWPISGIYTLGLFLAANLIVEGVGWMTVGFAAKPGASA
jgi:uncharacterized membrane protein HdeD (DUF308 family)